MPNLGYHPECVETAKNLARVRRKTNKIGMNTTVEMFSNEFNEF